jgi:hypothetical protein
MRARLALTLVEQVFDSRSFLPPHKYINLNGFDLTVCQAQFLEPGEHKVANAYINQTDEQFSDKEWTDRQPGRPIHRQSGS